MLVVRNNFAWYFRRPQGVPIPADFTHGFKNFRCTHGVMQASRGQGIRDAHSRFTDCQARFDAVVTKIPTGGSGELWYIIVKNEWRLHNHRAGADHVATGINEVPSSGPVVDTITVLHDANASSRQIARYASEELGA